MQGHVGKAFIPETWATELAELNKALTRFARVVLQPREGGGGCQSNVALSLGVKHNQCLHARVGRGLYCCIRRIHVQSEEVGAPKAPPPGNQAAGAESGASWGSRIVSGCGRSLESLQCLRDNLHLHKSRQAQCQGRRFTSSPHGCRLRARAPPRRPKSEDRLN
jgi:hypothetical protein